MIAHEFLETHTIFPSALLEMGPSATYLHALLQNSPIAIVVLDGQHRYVMCNPAFEKLFQYAPAQLASVDLDRLLSDPETKVHTVAKRRRRDGMLVDVEIYGIPLMVEGELAGVYGLYQDLTERNKARTAFREISDRFEHRQKEERRRLAQDLHDSTSQELAVLNWNLSRLMSRVGDQDESLQKLVAETKEIATKCSASIRSASYLLHPPLLHKAGLRLAVPAMAEGFEQRSGIRVKVVMTDGLGRFRDEVEIAIYRVVQEGLANVLRHSGSADATISLLCDGRWLELTVSDCGRGPAREGITDAHNNGRSLGISGMRERVEQLGGCLTIDCDADGTTLKARVPVEDGLHE
jgi:PAS domain S-box-containing protein